MENLKKEQQDNLTKKRALLDIKMKRDFIQKKSPFLIIEVGCHFNITTEAWSGFYNESKTELIVSRGFIGHLVMLTIGTTRGVLHSKTENTPFNNFLLPTLNVNELVKN